MSLAKVIEVIAEGETMEQAFESAISLAAKTVQDIKSVNAENIQAIVEDNKIARYRINAKITFVVKDR